MISCAGLSFQTDLFSKSVSEGRKRSITSSSTSTGTGLVELVLKILGLLPQETFSEPNIGFATSPRLVQKGIF